MKTIKNKSLVAMIVMAFAFVAFSSCEQESVVDENSLPTKAQEYLTTHFQGIPVIQVVRDVDGLSKSFDVYLENGIELVFKRNGDVKSVESKKHEELPASVIPAKILTYVQTNHAPHFIISWELDDARQDVELSNGMDLQFSKAGDFIRID